MICFSIIIPLFNKEKHIAHTIETVLNQSYADFELIVIDDGSTDRSAKIVSHIQDNRVNLISKENEGVSITRNKGVKLAKNDYIAFLDADDEWESDYLKRVAELIEGFPEAAMFATNYRVVERNGETYSLDYPLTPAKGSMGILKNYFSSAIEYTPIWTSAVCLRKDVFLNMGGFPTNIRNGEDLDLWCRIALKYPIAYMNEPLAVYRRDSENMLSRSITDPCWFPFLEDYSESTDDIIADKDSVEKYIVNRQLEAASAALLILDNRELCGEILGKVRFRKWNRKKYCFFKVMRFLPKRMINLIYKKRNIKTFE